MGALESLQRARTDPNRRGATSLAEYSRLLNTDLQGFEADPGGGRMATGYAPSRMGEGPYGGGATSSLGRAAGPAAVDPDDAIDYHFKQAALERTQHDNTYENHRQDVLTSDMDRARDPGIQLYEDQRRRTRASGDAEAADTIAGDSFLRMEPFRRVEQRERRQNAEEMLPLNPAVLQSTYKREGVLDTNDARRDSAQIAADARVGASATSSLARAAGTQTFGDPAAETRVNGAIDAIRPNVPGQAQGKLLSPQDYQTLVEHFGGDERAALALMAQHGYRR